MAAFPLFARRPGSAPSTSLSFPQDANAPLELIWTLFSLGAAVFLVALYALVFFHPAKTSLLLCLTLGPLVLRAVAAVAGRFAPLHKNGVRVGVSRHE